MPKITKKYVWKTDPTARRHRSLLMSKYAKKYPVNRVRDRKMQISGSYNRARALAHTYWNPPPIMPSSKMDALMRFQRRARAKIQSTMSKKLANRKKALFIGANINTRDPLWTRELVSYV